MNNKKFLIATALLMSALLLGGCATALLGPEDSSTASATASEDAATIIVAEVNGEAIYKDAFNEAYDNLMYQYYYAGADTTSETAIASIKQEALDSLIKDKVRDQKMTALGYSTLTAEELAQADADMVEDLLIYIEANCMMDVLATLEEGYTDEDLQAAKEAYVDTLLADNSLTREEFVVAYQEQVANKKALLAEKGEIAPTEEEIKAKFDEYVAADEETIKADPLSYVSSIGDGVTVYYVPADVRRVRHVLISLDEETSAAISLLRSEGYDTAADVLLQSGLAMIEEKANEVLGKIDSGDLTFEEAIAEYSGDPGQTEEGYVVMSNTTAYQDAFTQGAMGLAAVGEHTGLITTDYGYHIIEYYQDVPAGSISYDEAKEEISEELLDTMQGEAWNELLEQWKTEATVVTYDERL